MLCPVPSRSPAALAVSPGGRRGSGLDHTGPSRGRRVSGAEAGEESAPGGELACVRSLRRVSRLDTHSPSAGTGRGSGPLLRSHWLGPPARDHPAQDHPACLRKLCAGKREFLLLTDRGRKVPVRSVRCLVRHQVLSASSFSAASHKAEIVRLPGNI